MDGQYVFDEALATGTARIELYGDRVLAAAHVRDARLLLGGLRTMYGVNQRIADGQPGGFYSASKRLPDGTLIQAISNDGMDTLRVIAAGAQQSDQQYAASGEQVVETPLLWLSSTDGHAYEFDPRALAFTGRFAPGMGGAADAGGGQPYGTVQLLAAWDYLFALDVDNHGFDHTLSLKRVPLAAPADPAAPGRLDIDLTVPLALSGRANAYLMLAWDRRLLVIAQDDPDGSTYFRLTIQQIDADTGALLGPADRIDPAALLYPLPMFGLAALVTQHDPSGAERTRLMLPSSRQRTSAGYSGSPNLHNPLTGIQGTVALYYDPDTREFSAEELPFDEGQSAIVVEATDASLTRTAEYMAHGQERIAYDNIYGHGGLAVDADGGLWLPTVRDDRSAVPTYTNIPASTAGTALATSQTLLLRRSDDADPAATRVAHEDTLQFDVLYHAAPYSPYTNWYYGNPTAAATDGHAALTVEHADATACIAIALADGAAQQALLPPLKVRQLVGTDDLLFGVAQQRTGNDVAGYPFFSVDPGDGGYREHDTGSPALHYTRIAVQWERLRVPHDDPRALLNNPLLADLSDDQYWALRMVKTTNLLQT